MDSDLGSRTSATLLETLRERPLDQAAWDRFVDRYGPRVYGWCRAWHLQEQDAWDVTQDVLMKLVVRMKAFDSSLERGCELVAGFAVSLLTAAMAMSKSSDTQTSSTLLAILQQDPAHAPAWDEFVRRYEALRDFRYDPSRSFRAWLKTITQRAWSDMIAHRHRAAGRGTNQVLQRLQTLEARADLERDLEEAFDRELLEMATLRVQQRVAPQTSCPPRGDPDSPRPRTATPSDTADKNIMPPVLGPGGPSRIDYGSRGPAWQAGRGAGRQCPLCCDDDSVAKVAAPWKEGSHAELNT